MHYMIERLGDISGRTLHNTLEDAFAQLEQEYPKPQNTKGFQYIDNLVKLGKTQEIMELYWYGGSDNFSPFRLTPDPEDDRILIWEIQNNGKNKVVWHFSGWHWDAGEFSLPQGTLPGDNKSLYELANE